MRGLEDREVVAERALLRDGRPARARVVDGHPALGPHRGADGEPGGRV